MAIKWIHKKIVDNILGKKSQRVKQNIQDFRNEDGEPDYDDAAQWKYNVNYGQLDARQQRKVEAEVKKSMKFWNPSKDFDE